MSKTTRVGSQFLSMFCEHGRSTSDPIGSCVAPPLVSLSTIVIICPNYFTFPFRCFVCFCSLSCENFRVVWVDFKTMCFRTLVKSHQLRCRRVRPPSWSEPGRAHLLPTSWMRVPKHTRRTDVDRQTVLSSSGGVSARASFFSCRTEHTSAPSVVAIYPFVNCYLC